MIGLRVRLACLFLAGTVAAARAADEAPPSPPPLVSGEAIEKLTEAARKSLVVITHTGRDGKQQGLGSGFIVSADGLVATNYHVIGESRPIQVQTVDGKQHPVTAIQAHDRVLDLAVLKIDAQGLAALTLGDSASLRQGQPLVALGNPLGLKFSVATGVFSGLRELDKRSMLQLSMPVEPGNSGGPVLDLAGKVHGVVTMKALQTQNLAFALPSAALRPLLDKPNPIPMARWLTIGALDPRDWQVVYEARWRQRAGRITADGLGSGFGGRSLCVWQKAPPALPYDATVAVKLNDEAGAAGLIFEVEGDRHYGFYPSGGKLRFTRFDGDSVYTWKILHDQPSAHYQAGEFNLLRVRVEKDRLRCFVNDQLVVEVPDDTFRGGKVGLAKFRQTEAEFKGFRVGQNLGPGLPSAETAARIRKLVEGIPPRGGVDPDLAAKLAPEQAAQLIVLREEARLLDQQAARLRKLALAAHAHRVRAELVRELARPEAEIPLFRCGLLIALLDNDELEIEGYLDDLERMVREIRAGLPEKADEAARRAALDKHLFQDNGFHGSRGDYYHRSNSYLNEVLDDREGLPITLCVLYLELAQRLGMKMVGVGLPGHFIVRHEPAKGEPQLIDVYEGGKNLTREDVARLVREIAEVPLSDEHLRAVTKREIIVRMLSNLQGAAQRGRDPAAFLRYVDALVDLSPDDAGLRWGRARLIMAYLPEDRLRSLRDVEWLIDKAPEGIDLEEVRELRALIERLEER